MYVLVRKKCIITVSQHCGILWIQQRLPLIIHFCTIVIRVSKALFYKKYSTSSDMWSYGMVMYEIWSLGKKPFPQLSPVEVSMFHRLIFSFYVTIQAKIYECNFSVFRIYHINLSIVFLFLSGYWATNTYIWAAQCCEHEAMEYHQLVSVHVEHRKAAWVCACCNASSISTLSDHMLHPLIVLTSEMIGVAFLLQLACS